MLRESDASAFLLFAFIAVVSLMMRIESFDYIMESLWCEDSFLLINQSYELGIQSLWEPMVGYLHLYHRIVALIATGAPLIAAPIIFFCGWIVAFLTVVWAIITRAREVGLERAAALFAILAISLQPNSGEVFLNLGQSFYILSIALALYVCLPSSRPVKVPQLILLAVMSLSGPASEILAVILVIRLMLLRDFALRKWEYVVVWSCALIQAILTLKFYVEHGSERVPNTNIAEWFHAAGVFLLFGADGKLVTAASLVFWAITIALLAEHLLDVKRPHRVRVGLLLLMLTACAFFAASIRRGAYMNAMSPIDNDSRYYVLPYSLALFVAFVVTRDRLNARLAVLFSIGLICGASFLTLDREGREGRTGMWGHEPMQWVAFNKFREIDPDVIIPTNPPWAVWPPTMSVWVAAERGANNSERESVLSLGTDLADVTSSNASFSHANDGIHISSPDRIAEILIPLGNRCPGSEYLAFEVDVWTSGAGWARLHWGDATGFTKEKSLRRFYPSEDMTMQFAFRRELSDSMLRLDVLGGVEHWLWQGQGGPNIPPPSPPGGDAWIKGMRMFCLE